MRSPPADIFVWGVHPETTKEDIVNDLAESGIVISTNDILKKSKEGAALNSYKISVPAADLQRALAPDIWPLRVKVREYVYYPRKAKPQSQNQEENKKDQNQQEVDKQDNQLSVPQPQSQQLAQVSGVKTSNMFDALANVEIAKDT